MTLEEILAHIAHAKENVSTLKAGLKYYLVVMLGTRQYQLSQISKHNIDLFEFPDIFAPNQQANKFQKRWSKYQVLKIQSDDLKKKAESKQNKNQEAGQKFQGRLEKALALMSVIQTDLEKQLETIRFIEPQIEMRFGQVEMDAIQEIKEFPFIKTLGKTDASAASIRIIIG